MIDAETRPAFPDWVNVEALNLNPELTSECRSMAADLLDAARPFLALVAAAAELDQKLEAQITAIDELPDELAALLHEVTGRKAMWDVLELVGAAAGHVPGSTYNDDEARAVAARLGLAYPAEVQS